MKKLGWFALRVAVAAFVLAGLVLLAANLYVQSHGVQQRIRTAVEASLQVRVQLQKTTVTPWEGLRLDGIAFQADESGTVEPSLGYPTTDFLTAASFRVRFAWWPLLTRQQLVIEQVLLDKPCLTWQQGDDGRWSFPPGQDRTRPAEANELARAEASASAPTTAQKASPPPPAVADGPTPGSLPAAEKSVRAAAETARSAGFPLLISKLRVRHGEMNFLDREQRSLFRVEEINSDGVIIDAHHIQGTVDLGRAGTSSTALALTNYRTAVDLGDQGELTLRDGRGTLAGGALRTDFRVQPQAAGQAFSASGRLEHVALGRLTHNRDDQPPLADGEFNANLDCHGFTDDPASRTGGGRLWLAGARLRESAPLKLLGQLLRISDLTQLELKQADMNYKLEGTALRIESLVLAANDIGIVAHGTYQTDADQLDVHGRLTIDQAISHQLPQFIESNFVPCGPEAAGSRYLDFDVTGPADDPKSNLYDRLTAGPMKGLLDNLLAPKSKTPRNKPRSPVIQAPSSPALPHLP